LLGAAILRENILEYLVIDENKRGSGAGTTIMRALILQHKPLYLECEPHLLSFYYKFGAKHIHTDKPIFYDYKPYFQMKIT
jgi:predicted GNAT family N-acyltransferase